MTVRILQGDCMEVLKTLPDESVDCVVSSPPYWRQRDYGHPGQLGLEPTPEEYIDKLTAIFAQCRRILKIDGTCWVNLGDKWASGGNGGGGSFMEERSEAWAHVKNNTGWRKPPTGYKDKDLVGLPWMLAFAMRAEGWFLRQCNIWAKPNGMPESVRDRSTVSHEYVFHFAKNNDYWYDTDAARTPPPPDIETQLRNSIDARKERQKDDAKSAPTAMRNGIRRSDKQRGHTRRHDGFNDRWDAMEKSEQMAQGSNLRSVWWIAPAQYKEGHYAVMPAGLAEICITAGCKPGGTVLDPFGGAGTTGLVADRLQRHAILIELNPEYAAMARRRIEGDAPLFAEVA
jgi:DNA modification methylase